MDIHGHALADNALITKLFFPVYYLLFSSMDKMNTTNEA